MYVWQKGKMSPHVMGCARARCMYETDILLDGRDLLYTIRVIYIGRKGGRKEIIIYGMETQKRKMAERWVRGYAWEKKICGE